MNRKLLNEELNRKTPEEYRESAKSPVVLVLDNIRSQHNIGSAFRTADAFMVEKIFLCGFTATPPNNEIHKTALGAENIVPWQHFESTAAAISLLKEQGYIIVSVEQAERSVVLDEFVMKQEGRYAFVFGNEVKGVAQDIVDMSDLCIEIPQSGTKHSLNVSVSIGIVLWDVVKKIKGNG